MTMMAVIMVCLPYNTNCLPCIELLLIMKSSAELTEDDKGPSPQLLRLLGRTMARTQTPWRSTELTNIYRAITARHYRSAKRVTKRRRTHNRQANPRRVMALLLRRAEERGIPSEHICHQGEEGEQKGSGKESRWVLCFL